MSEKRQKSSSVQAREGKIQKKIPICPNFSKDQLRDKNLWHPLQESAPARIQTAHTGKGEPLGGSPFPYSIFYF